MKDFSIFYAIALFTLYIDMYSKISSKDGTDDQKYHYTIEVKEEPEAKSLVDDTVNWSLYESI